MIAPSASSATPISGKYEMKASADGALTLVMYGEVGWDFTAKSIARDLANYPKITSVSAYIQSGGGSVMDGFAIYNMLARLPVPKTLYVEAVAASMATVIAMAFDKVVMPSNTFMMVHSNWGGVCGTAEDLRDYADLLDRWKESMAKAYRDKTKQPDEVINGWMSKDTWFSADEALAVGLADEVIEPIQMAASIDPKRLQEFDNMPKELQALFAPQGNTQLPGGQPAPAPTQPAPATAPVAITAPAPVAAVIENPQARIDSVKAVFAAFPQHSDLLLECLGDASITADMAKDKILAKLGEGTTPAAVQPRSVIIHAGNGNIVGDSIRAHLMARAGHAAHEKDNGYSSYNLRELARASLVDRGIGVASMNVMQMVGLAFTHSTSDFGNILLDVANKSVLKGWEAQPESFERFCKKGQLSDFKIANRVGLEGFKALDKVEEGAEYKYATLSDRGEKIMLATYGKIFSITRQAIINDDMNMLQSVPEKMGRAAKRTIGNLVWAIITGNPKMSDGKALFHADHKNLGAGAPSVETISALCELMESQMIGEDPLNIQPAFALVPPNLNRTMLQIIKSASVKGADANSGIANPIQDLLEVISEPRLKTHSDKAWYVAAGLGEDTIEVAYLDGIDTPYIEQQDGFTVDGVATKVRIDAGVAPLDHRGLAKSTGV